MMSSFFWMFLIIINIDISYSTICDANQDCSIDCNTLQPCQNKVITCPTNGKCEIKCEDNSSCKNTTINAQQSSLLNITGCITHNSCLLLSIHCPPYSNNQHPNCYIQGNNNLNKIQIYAINGWKDIKITHIGNNSIQHSGTMYCSNDMSKQCIIAPNNWLCTDNICDVISLNDNGPILNQQEDHLFTIHFSVEIILIFFGIITLLIVCIIGCCCIYKLHSKYNVKTIKDPMDVIHNINIPVSSVSPQDNGHEYENTANSSFGGQIIFGQHTPSISNNNITASNLTLNIPSSIAEISVHDIADSYHHKRHAHTIDISHSINESNNIFHSNANQKRGRASMGTYTPTEIQLAALRNGMNISPSSLVPPSLNNINSNNSLQISPVHSVSPSPKSIAMDYNGNNNGNSMQYLGVNGRSRNCTLSDMHIDLKALPLSPPDPQINALNMDMNDDEIHIEKVNDSYNENENSNDEGNGTDSDLFIQQEENKTPQGPQPPPVPKHILANYID